MRKVQILPLVMPNCPREQYTKFSNSWRIIPYYKLRWSPKYSNKIKKEAKISEFHVKKIVRISYH